MYPGGDPQIRVNPGPRGEILEGASRPGFFHGVLTVVLKLLQIIQPGRAARFVRNFMTGHDNIEAALASYVGAVRDGSFPAPEHCF